MLGDDGNQIGAHSALLAASKQSEDGRTLHSALERFFSGIHLELTIGANGV
jgi:hypothetical protein